MFETRLSLFSPLILGALGVSYLPIWFSGNAEIIAPQNIIPTFAICLGLILWWSAGRQTVSESDRCLALILAMLFIIPSTQIAWLVVLLLALWLWHHSHKNSRVSTAMLIIGVAALQPLLMTYLLKWLAAPVLTVDAALVAHLLKMTTGSGSHIGNIIYGPSDHQLLILRGCSSLTNVGSAWLAWFALSRFKGITLNKREIIVLILLTLSLVSLNLLRLYSMAIDLAWHQWWHSNIGQQVYQLSSVSLLLLSIGLGVHYVGLHKNKD